MEERIRNLSVGGEFTTINGTIIQRIRSGYIVESLRIGMNSLIHECKSIAETISYLRRIAA